jgi:hypothetical protein
MWTLNSLSTLVVPYLCVDWRAGLQQYSSLTVTVFNKNFLFFRQMNRAIVNHDCIIRQYLSLSKMYYMFHIFSEAIVWRSFKNTENEGTSYTKYQFFLLLYGAFW